jgi:hypothetical protein
MMYWSISDCKVKRYKLQAIMSDSSHKCRKGETRSESITTNLGFVWSRRKL